MMYVLASCHSSQSVVAALKQFPLLNAEIQGDELIIKNSMISVLQ